MARRILARLAALLALVAGSFACNQPRAIREDTRDAGTRFEELARYVTRDLMAADPGDAVSLGLHTFDGQLPDVSPEGLADQIARFGRARTSLEAIDGKTLSDRQRVEREVLLYELRGRLFRLVDLDVYRTNPMAYSAHVNLDAYILRDYAPAHERAAAVIRLCNALPGYLAQARNNLRLPLPRTFVDTALLQTTGYAEFADKDVRMAFPIAGIPLVNQGQIDPALDRCVAALREHSSWLEARKAEASDRYALGEAKFLKMLAETQGVDVDLARLAAIAEADLARNLAAMDEAARAIAPGSPTREVVDAAAKDRPSATTVLAVATAQATQMRAFVLAKQIVSIPSEDVAVVRESPPFQRWNSAFLESAGPFEARPLPSYYYITPPDPAWPEAEQLAYLPPTQDLLFTTIHEVYPGHFLHKLHIRNNPSRILQSFCTYSNSEGWAHYTEEMMFEQGAGGGTPHARIGMLKEALLRNARFVATIELHTRGATVEAMTKLFADKGFVDAGNARQQAVRGTFDPMYLAYTLGKHMIRKLRDDWTRAKPGRTLEQFHDTLLSYACAPLPVIRAAMLGPNAGPPI